MSKPLVVVDADRLEIFVRGREIKFPPAEFAMLSALITTNKALTREQMADAAGCVHGSMSSRTVDQHIARARRRLGRDRDLIATIQNHGYRYEGLKKK
jgi:DNA-binding response OmpR family regulator